MSDLDFKIKPLGQLPFRVLRKLQQDGDDEKTAKLMFSAFFDEALAEDDRDRFDELPIAEALEIIENWADKDALGK